MTEQEVATKQPKMFEESRAHMNSENIYHPPQDVKDS